MSEDLDALIARMWDGLAPLARSRVEVLELYAAALAGGRDDAALRSAATADAHMLSGALGSYGRSGSAEAAQLEQLLRPEAGTPPAKDVTARVTALRAAVGP